MFSCLLKEVKRRESNPIEMFLRDFKKFSMSHKLSVVYSTDSDLGEFVFCCSDL